MTTTMMTTMMMLGTIGDSGNATKMVSTGTLGKWKAERGHYNEHGGLGIVL